MKFLFNRRHGLLGNANAFTLAEVVIATAVAAITIVGIVNGYILAAKRAEWSGFSLAAQALAVQRIEQTRACKWDTEAGVDQLVTASFPVSTVIFDLPVSGTNFTIGTNYTTITTISATPPLLKMIRVDCVWRLASSTRLFSNTVVTYRGPDN